MKRLLFSIAVLAAMALSASESAAAQDAKAKKIMMPESPSSVISLDGDDWSLTFWRQGEEPICFPEGIKSADTRTIPASVPGNVDIDLMASGLEEDPRIGLNNYLTRKWEDYQWCYTKRFSAPKLEAGKKYFLWFGGIDTIADIWLGDNYVGRTENMMIEHCFDVSELLEEGENTLYVIIQSSVLYGRQPFFGAISLPWSITTSISSTSPRKTTQ